MSSTRMPARKNKAVAVPLAAEFVTITTTPVYSDALPRRAASDIKNKWGDIQQAVKAKLGLAIASRGSVEYVIIPVATYDAMVKDVLGVNERKQKALDDLSHKYDAMITQMQDSGSRARIDAFFDTEGKADRPGTAGRSY